jgi:hypothetical protein
MAGALAISFTEMKAWAEMTGADPSPWEVSVLERMDAASLAAMAKSAPLNKDEPSAPIDASDGREVIGFMRSLAAGKKGGGSCAGRD